MYDVIVAGAGPAGSTCARVCAKQGLKTLLLDKDAFPRAKQCGGAVSAQALSCLDFPLPGAVIEKECYGAQVRCSNRAIDVRKEQRIAVLVSREHFDCFLKDKAVESGAQFLAEEKIVDIQEANDAVTVLTEKGAYKSRFLIGADGLHSRVAWSVRPPLTRQEMVLASLCHVRADDREIDKRLEKTILLHFGIAPLGYGWLFPHRGYYSVGAAGLASGFPDPKKTLFEFGRTMQVQPGPVRGGFIPLGGVKRRIASKRILLAGDAAGFADPFHGEGIAHAILSGKLAAEAVVDGIQERRGPDAVASRYTQECERLIRKQLRVALLMARLLDRFPALFVRIFFDNISVLEHYLEIPAGKSDYLRFLRWLAVRLPFYLLSSFLRELRVTRLVPSRFP